jgi:hypothetical protein
MSPSPEKTPLTEGQINQMFEEVDSARLGRELDAERPGSPKKEEAVKLEGWPKVKLIRPPDWTGDKVWVVEADQPTNFRSCVYVPESAPNVLTPDEARLLVKARDDIKLNVAEYQAAEELCNRLSAWAEGEGSNRGD